jgi:hypothetical protein
MFILTAIEAVSCHLPTTCALDIPLRIITVLLGPNFLFALRLKPDGFDARLFLASIIFVFQAGTLVLT